MVDIIGTADLPADLQAQEMAETWVAGANARALRVAPCLASDDPAPTDGQLAEAKLVLIGAIARWAEAGSGARTSQQAGPFMLQTDTGPAPGYNLWPSEITSLQDICADKSEEKAFSVDTAPSLSGTHADWCSLNTGANYCSCGANIAGFPIYEQA